MTDRDDQSDAEDTGYTPDRSLGEDALLAAGGGCGGLLLLTVLGAAASALSMWV
jgi:hypothetical protein